MSNFLSFIEGYMEGNAWEDLCVKCYRIRFQSDNYTPIPAKHKGDAGIEGFTHSGKVHQCYCPEREYSDNELYDHQRNKLSIDIAKLRNNATRLKKFGVPAVVEWHYNIPEYRDVRILIHAEKKRQEVLNAKATNPSAYTHIADNFKIIVKTAEDFSPEISRIIRTNLSDLRLNFAIVHKDIPDWSKCDSQKVANIQRKLKAVTGIANDSDESLNKLTNIYVSFYINGLETKNRLRVCFPETYENVHQLEQSYKNDVSITTLLNTDRSMNNSIFQKILEEFQRKLEFEFSHKFTIASIGELKQIMISSWLADCSMEFRSV